MRTKYKLGKPTVSLYAEKLMHKMLDDKTFFNQFSNLVGEKLSAKYVQHFAKIPELSPAILDRTLNVVASLEPENQTAFATTALNLFNQTLSAQSFKKIEPLVESVQVDYSLDFVSCKANIHKISEGLKRTK